MIAAAVQCDVDGIPKGSHYLLLKRANVRVSAAAAHDGTGRRRLQTRVSPLMYLACTGRRSLVTAYGSTAAPPEHPALTHPIPDGSDAHVDQGCAGARLPSLRS